MSRTKKIEQLLEMLLSNRNDDANELSHQIIVDMSRDIYESIENEELDKSDNAKDKEHEVGGEANKDFTNEISSDKDDIDADHLNDGEASDKDFDFEDEDDESTKDRIDDLESELEELKSEFNRLMGEELKEPNHADLAAEYGEDDSDDSDEFSNEFDEEKSDDGHDFEDNKHEDSAMFETAKKEKLKKAMDPKDKKKHKKVDEETQFLTKIGDTGQSGTAKLAGTGKGMSLGAEQTKSTLTTAPSRKDFGGTPVNFSKGTGGEYGKYNGASSGKTTSVDNRNISPKGVGIKADTTAKYTGGKSTGSEQNKSPLSNRPRQ